MEYVITAKNNPQMFNDVAIKGEARAYEFDFSPWAENNHNVTTATWSVENGNAAISGQALTSNVASALITFSEIGRNLIKLTANTGTEKYVTWLNVLVKDPNDLYADDYGLGT